MTKQYGVRFPHRSGHRESGANGAFARQSEDDSIASVSSLARLASERSLGQSVGVRNERYYAAGVITAFLNGSCGASDWDAFTSRPLRDVELDRIRQCALVVDLPLDSDGRATLLDLLDQVELVDSGDRTGPKAWRMETGALAGLFVGAILWWTSYLPGQGLFHNLHLLLFPAALGSFAVALRNSRHKVGAFDPRIVAQNKQGRV